LEKKKSQTSQEKKARNAATKVGLISREGTSLKERSDAPPKAVLMSGEPGGGAGSREGRGGCWGRGSGRGEGRWRP